jgi:hypothetical protein
MIGLNVRAFFFQVSSTSSISCGVESWRPARRTMPSISSDTNIPTLIIDEDIWALEILESAVTEALPLFCFFTERWNRNRNEDKASRLARDESESFLIWTNQRPSPYEHQILHSKHSILVLFLPLHSFCLTSLSLHN